MAELMGISDAALIEEFAATRSQGAFAEIVRRHVDLVYSAARRQSCDDADAQDATQQVFALLAQKAAKLRGGTMPVSAWLFASTRYVCANARRTRQRRKRHERKAAAMRVEEAAARDSGGGVWTEIAPMLDEAIDSLGEGERNVVLLRFFERRSLREVGEALKISEDAARKRVDRATEKLRAFFARAGVATAATPAVTIEAMLLANAVTKAPAALGGAVLAGGATTVGAGAVGATVATAGAVKWGTVAAATLILVGAVGSAAVLISAKRQAATTAAQPIQSATHGAPQQPPLRAPVGTLSPPLSEMRATLSNGMTVELLGISGGAGDEPQRWWTASGAPTTRPVVSADYDDAMRDYPRANVLRFMVRTLPPAEPPARNNLEAVGRAMRLWEVGLLPIPSPQFRAVSYAAPNLQPTTAIDRGIGKIAVAWDAPPPETVRLALGVASGAWLTAAESRTPTQVTQHTPRADKPQHKMTFGRLEPWRGRGTRMNLSFPADLYHYGVDMPESRVVAVVNGTEIVGRRLPSSDLHGGGYGDVVEFDDVAPETITAVRYQTRPYEPVIFEKVSTRPGVRSEPWMKVMPPGASMR